MSLTPMTADQIAEFKAARRFVRFSCGAASAVAAMLTLKKYPHVVLSNAYLAEEHEDNRRFLADVERWLGVEIVVVRDEKYDASAYNVFRRERFIKGRNGAPCRERLKGRPLDKLRQPGDIVVLGYTAEEVDRADNLRDRAPDVQFEFPLIDEGITKPAALGIIEKAGINLPIMYRLGFNNANCIGCPKGGMGYWNMVRKFFPERFMEMSAIEQELGPGSYLFQGPVGEPRISLAELDPDRGRHSTILPDCDMFCASREDTNDE